MVLTVREALVLLLSVHRIPVPPLPAVALMVREPPHCVPPPLMVGTAGLELIVANTAVRAADRQPLELLRACA